MIVKGLLVDLDGTLINSSKLDTLRLRKDWRSCAQNLDQTTVFDGIYEMLRRAKSMGIGVGVVTSSVSFYAEAVLKHHKLAYDILVAYHDVSRRKPSPDPYTEGAKRLGMETGVLIGLGDAAEDAISLKAANIRAYGAGWSDRLQHHESWYDIFSDPAEVPF